MQCYDYSFRKICLDVVIDLAERRGVEGPGAKSVFWKVRIFVFSLALNLVLNHVLHVSRNSEVKQSVCRLVSV